jgi:hypothetical protein
MLQVNILLMLHVFVAGMRPQPSKIELESSLAATGLGSPFEAQEQQQCAQQYSTVVTISYCTTQICLWAARTS